MFLITNVKEMEPTKPLVSGFVGLLDVVGLYIVSP